MTRPYSEDLRERVVRVVESGTSRNAAAKQFDVSISFVVKLMQRWKQRGTIADRWLEEIETGSPSGDRIRALVMENCDITIDELCVLLAAEGIEAKRSTLGDFLLEGLARQPTPPSRSALTSRRREPLAQRATWAIAERLVFLDETWARTNMPALWRAPRGERVGHSPWPGRQPRSLPPCVTTGSPRPDGPINGASFLASSKPWSTLSAGDSHQQPLLPQGRRHAIEAVRRPAALQPRSQSHRTGLRQAQSHSPQGRRQNRPSGGQLETPSMNSLQLPRQCRIFRLNRMCSSELWILSISGCSSMVMSRESLIRLIMLNMAQIKVSSTISASLNWAFTRS